ncbi:hypothetical protein [uncultured Rubinisphaera sp.]|uniref:hypothetical protein n=1 Tax=uncultured Rubinisphaera sp. TaxID=1678686 RepID=UPI0030DAA788|tara:strand:+ start:245 stop:508 length:264 start_codon:yes stop_codon:yes gene_type:complete
MTNILLAELNELPKSVLQKISISNSEFGITINKGAMQIYLKENRAGDIEIQYESQLHEMTTQFIPRKDLLHFLIAVIDRNKLCKIDL